MENQLLANLIYGAIALVFLILFVWEKLTYKAEKMTKEDIENQKILAKKL